LYFQLDLYKKSCDIYYEYLQDILEFIEESPNGVIFFTFGTVVALSTLPDHIQIAFKNALAEVPQRVLLKYEGEMTDKPKNVMTSKWLPQRDILSMMSSIENNILKLNSNNPYYIVNYNCIV